MTFIQAPSFHHNAKQKPARSNCTFLKIVVVSASPPFKSFCQTRVVFPESKLHLHAYITYRTRTNPRNEQTINCKKKIHTHTAKLGIDDALLVRLQQMRVHAALGLERGVRALLRDASFLWCGVVGCCLYAYVMRQTSSVCMKVNTSQPFDV